MTTATHNYGWLMPDPGGSANTWGNTLNGATQAIDNQVKVNESAIAGINARSSIGTLFLQRGPDGGAYAQIDFTNNGGSQSRWIFFETSEAETGGNAGSNFGLANFDDTGAPLHNPISINRATGTATFGPVGCASLNVAGNINCNSISATTNISVPSVSSPTVNATTVNATTVNVTTVGATTVNAATVNASGAVSGAGLTANKGSNPNAALFLNDGSNRSAFYYDDATLQTVVVDFTSGAQLTLDSVANFHFNGTSNAFKAGGGSWSSTSDARIKTVMGDYLPGLDEVLQLRPVSYVYKGNDAPPRQPSPTKLVEGRQFVGFVAQELERVMPDMVSKRAGYIDGKKVTDLRDVDVSALIFALVNSVKDLKAEIDELKGAR